MTAVARRAREAGKGRSIYVVAENEPQDSRLVRPIDAGGSGLNALWNDDLHHACRVALTSRNEGYFTVPASGTFAYMNSSTKSLGKSDIFRLALPEAGTVK